MSTVPSRNLLMVMLVGVLGVSVSPAQWSADPAANLSIADLASNQADPKICATSDGGCYISWSDNQSGMYMQRLDTYGYEQWPHNGILIAACNSTTTYGLAVDASDNAIIAFPDGRFGTPYITVQKISPAGSLLWNGSLGVQLGPATLGASPPKVAVLSDGNYVVIWNNNASPVGTLIQKLDPDGVPQFPGNGILQNDTQTPQVNLFAAWVARGDNGSIIASFVRMVSMYNMYLYTQKYDPAGVAQWNGGVPMQLGGGITIGQLNTLTFYPDGNGGAVYSWCNGSEWRAYIQHVQADGSPKFYSPICVTPTCVRYQLSAGLAYNTSTGEYFVSCYDVNDWQGDYSAIVQRFDAAGNPLWGECGVSLTPITTEFQPQYVQSQIMGAGVAVFWKHGNVAFGGMPGTIKAVRLMADGTIAWNELLDSDDTEKIWLVSTLSTCGFGMVAYADSSDIQAQNVYPSGALGNPPPCVGDLNCDGSVSFGDINPFVLYISDFTAWQLTYSGCPPQNGDVNGDGLYPDFGDINPFVALLTGG